MSELISFDYESRALKLCEMRTSLIARNLANSNTPHFKAQDINFEEAMRQAKTPTSLASTHANHLSPTSTSGHKLYYRVPMQDRLDDNSVDNEIERKNFIENSLKYQASLGFINKKASQYLKAIKGE